jgi:succinate dehydrogenase hydrophobic anchor subunit
MKSGGSISIWFFIGISLVVNGILILGAGLYEYVHPPANPVILFRLHASIWWGALMLLIGAAYCYHFSPGKEAARN